MKPDSSQASIATVQTAQEESKTEETNKVTNFDAAQREEAEVQEDKNSIEDIESRYSDGDKQETTKQDKVADQSEEQKEDAQTADVPVEAEEMNGETGTTDLNRNEVVVQPSANTEETTGDNEEAKSSSETPIEGTADMIMRRAEQRGDFDKYDDKKKDE